MRRRSSSLIAPSPPTAAAPSVASTWRRRCARSVGSTPPPPSSRRRLRCGRTMGRRIAASPTCWRSRASSTRAAGTMNGRWRSTRIFSRRATAWQTCACSRAGWTMPWATTGGSWRHDRTPPRPTAISALRSRRKTNGTRPQRSINARSRSSRSSSTSTATSAGCCWRGAMPPRRLRSPGAGCRSRRPRRPGRSSCNAPSPCHPCPPTTRRARIFAVSSPARWRRAGPVPASCPRRRPACSSRATSAGTRSSASPRRGRGDCPRPSCGAPTASRRCRATGCCGRSWNRHRSTTSSSNDCSPAPVSPCWSRRRGRMRRARSPWRSPVCTARWRSNASSTNTSLPAPRTKPGRQRSWRRGSAPRLGRTPPCRRFGRSRLPPMSRSIRLRAPICCRQNTGRTRSRPCSTSRRTSRCRSGKSARRFRP